VALNVPRDPGVALHNQLEETERGLVYDLSTLIDRRPGPQARRPDDDQRGADVDRRLRAVRERVGGRGSGPHCERHVVGCERVGRRGRGLCGHPRGYSRPIPLHGSRFVPVLAARAADAQPVLVASPGRAPDDHPSGSGSGSRPGARFRPGDLSPPSSSRRNEQPALGRRPRACRARRSGTRRTGRPRHESVSRLDHWEFRTG
jgi:hypothetical protein